VVPLAPGTVVTEIYTSAGPTYGTLSRPHVGQYHLPNDEVKPYIAVEKAGYGYFSGAFMASNDPLRSSMDIS
jgi:hypothetical protein